MTNVGRRETARRFLEGLSTDELLYIAEYVGAQIIDADPAWADCDRNEAAHRIERYQATRGCCELAGGDIAHKMIVLLEFLTMSELQQHTMAWSVAGGSA
jgi:hypothetical protein